MQKSLSEIQKENRKFILSALETVDDSLSKDLFYSIPLTLSRVLLAISKHGYYDDIYFGDLHGDSYETLEFDIEGVSFDLTKETLEEQSEETQRGINKFFND